MNSIKLTKYFLIVLLLLACQNKNTNTNKRIDVKYINYTIETVGAPKWEDIISGKRPKFLVRSSIVNETVYDSIVLFVNKLKPICIDSIPSKCHIYLQCIIHYPNSRESVLLLGRSCISLNGVIMVNNDSLISIINRNKGIPPLR